MCYSHVTAAVRCIMLKGGKPSCLRLSGRGERIRTSGPCLPKTVLYQAELLPDRIGPDRSGRCGCEAGAPYRCGLRCTQAGICDNFGLGRPDLQKGRKRVSQPHYEQQYLDLMRRIWNEGDQRVDRTGIGTRSVFGAMLRFDLTNGAMPLITTKRVYWKTATRELLWFLTGNTNIRPLVLQGVKIWNEWPHVRYVAETGEQVPLEEFVQRIADDEAFAARWGDLGPVYGQQWRAWQTEDGRPIDQVARLLDDLKNTPHSRRHIVSAWNVGKVDQMALPPCHLLFQFYVHEPESERPGLSCQLYQRSADLFLGVPFNIASYSLFVLMIAQVLGYEPRDFVHTFGDLHLYSNHLEQAELQLTRDPRPLPALRLNPNVTDIDSFKFEDFTLENYDPHPHIKAEISV